jgi:hypothetical protein
LGPLTSFFGSKPRAPPWIAIIFYMKIHGKKT